MKIQNFVIQAELYRSAYCMAFFDRPHDGFRNIAFCVGQGNEGYTMFDFYSFQKNQNITI